MAVPKRRKSRPNTRSRRAQWNAPLTDLVPIRIAGVTMKAPRLLPRAYSSGMLSVDDLRN